MVGVLVILQLVLFVVVVFFVLPILAETILLLEGDGVVTTKVLFKLGFQFLRSFYHTGGLELSQ